jgi:hypothetical protein
MREEARAPGVGEIPGGLKDLLELNRRKGHLNSFLKPLPQLERDNSQFIIKVQPFKQFLKFLSLPFPFLKFRMNTGVSSRRELNTLHYNGKINYLLIN